MKTSVYTHPSGLLHDTGAGHPERPERLQVILDLLEEQPFSDLPRMESRKATLEEITRAHPESYVLAIEEAIQSGATHLDGDTAVCHASWDAALHAAGAVCQAVDDIAADTTTCGFCAMRPPGHHAEASQAMGFCIFNNVFIGALHAQAVHGFEKIVIVDFDVHHGNGSDSMAREHEGIYYASTHQYPLFPLTGEAHTNTENILNIPLEGNSDSEVFRNAYEEKIIPWINDIAPDIIMISAGFDAHQDDPLAGLHLTENDFAWVTQKLCRLAQDQCGGKIVSTLEGGYDLNALKASVAAHLKALTTS